MKIEIISGSPRNGSITRRAALHLHNWLNNHTPHQAGLIDLIEWPLPAIQNVWASPDKAPAEFQPLAQRIFNADAYILVTPEYNGSYSPALKNLLDHFPKRHHKPFGIVTASTGAMGGMRASQQLLQLVPALFGVASPYMLIIPAVDKKFSPEGELLDETFGNNINNFMAEFLWLSEKLVTESVTA